MVISSVAGGPSGARRAPHFTGYRHYTLDEVPTGQVVRRFRDLGMPLDQLRTS